MAGNMQPMGGPGGPGGNGGMMPQQAQQFGSNPGALKGQMQNYLLQAIKNCPPPPGGLTWHNTLSLQERLGKAMHLATNVNLANQGKPNVDVARIAEYAASFERRSYSEAPSKEAWTQLMDNECSKYFQQRARNLSTMQNELNQNVQAQQQHQQQQNMMGMQFAQQMGRGMPPNFQQQMQHPMQMPNMQAQQQQQFRQQQQPQSFQQQQFAQQQFRQQQQQQQMSMGIGNNVNNQGGSGMAQNPAMMGMQQNRPPMMQDIAKLAPADRKKVSDLANKMLSEASPDKRQLAQTAISQRVTADQLQRMVAQGHNPLVLYFQQQAYHVLRANAQSVQNRQAGPAQGQPGQQGAQQQNLNAGQAPMMQQQLSRQSFQQRQNMANSQATNDFNQQFANNPQLDSIMDQQLKGFIAQENGQPVVPATNANSRPPSSQPMAVSMSNQNQNQAQNQTPRPPQQQQQQPTQQQTQQQLAMQMRMNQQNQQNQAQLHPQAAMQQQGAGPSQSPGMGTLNTPVSRSVNGMDQANGQGMQNFQAAQGQAWKQAMQTNPGLMNAFMSAIPPDQRQQVAAMSQEQLRNAIGRWQAAQQRQGAQGQQNQMQQQQQRPPSQMGQNVNMGGQPVQGMPPQMGQPNGFNQSAQSQGGTGLAPAQSMMDSMDLPPNLHNQEPFANIPQEVRKWKDLRAWLSQNPNGISVNVRNGLTQLQHRQFQTIMQKRMQEKMAQNPNMNQNMMQGQPQQPQQQQPHPPQQQAAMQQQQQQNMQRPVPNGLPAHLQHVSQSDIASVRQNNLGGLQPNTSDEQVRRYVQAMRFQRWQKMPEAQRAQIQAQAQFQANGQQAGPNGQVQQQPTPVQMTPQQAPAPAPAHNMAQNAQPKQSAAPSKAQTPTTNKNKKAAQPAQAAKNLKRGSDNISTDGNNAQQQRKGSQAGKNANAAATTGEDGNAAQAKKPSQQHPSDGSDNLSRLRTIGQEEQKNFSQEAMPDIQMSPSEYAMTVEKLRRIVVDMGKIGRGLSKWYGISKDDDRARAFFRMRLRIIKQFNDGEQMKEPRSSFSVNAAELDSSRNMLEGMARDIATHFTKPKMQAAQGHGMQPDAQTAAQAANAQEFANPQQRLIAQKQQQQLMQQQQLAQQAQKAQQSRAEQDQSAPVPLNAANLEKNAQALKNAKANKSSKAPSAPTTSQPPFQIPGTSPHGNPSYGTAPKKDFNLSMPPTKKRAKLDKSGQNSQTATPSPQVATKTPPVPQPQSQKAQAPSKPAVLCKDPECQDAMEGYADTEALERHVQEEHVRPKQDPVKFLAENLALALGLEADGTPKKGQKQPPPMSRGASKQGVSALGTPKSEPGSMNRSASLQSKADPKAKSAPASPKTAFNAQVVFAKLGFPNGISAIAWDPSVLRNLTPKETPESAKDSGASEPNTELFDTSLPDLAMDWNWRASNEDVLLGPPIPWTQEYASQPGDDELLRNSNYKETDWSDVDLWNTQLPNQINNEGWSMEVS